MRKAHFVIILFVVATFAVPTFSFAQQSGSAASMTVPRLMRYSGVVANADGSPRSGVVGLLFSLYKEQQGGRSLWTEIQNVKLDADGRYTVLLGSEHSEGLPAEIFTSNEARWLGVQVEAEPEQPRHQLGLHGREAGREEVPHRAEVELAVVGVGPVGLHGRGRPPGRPVTSRPKSRRLVADGLDVVSVRIEHIGAVVVRVVVRAQPGRAVVLAAGGDGGAIEGVDGGPVLGCDRNVQAAIETALVADPEIGLAAGTEAGGVMSASGLRDLHD